MLIGVLIIYLPLSLMQGLAVAASALVGMALALYFTRKPPSVAKKLEAETALTEG